jgi:co-chaperonin GroES (HSP10)
MKRILSTLVISSIIILPALSQNEDKGRKLETLENNEQRENQDTLKVEVGDKVLSVKESGDETNITVGKKEYRVIEDKEGKTVYRHDREDGDKEIYHRRNDRFRGHLGGFEFGLNGFLTDYWTTALAPEDNYFDLNTAKSTALNFYFPNINIGIFRHFGIESTVGINVNNYRFDHNNSITKDENGVIVPFYPETGITYTKSKLLTAYATVPVMVELQLPVNGNHSKTINIAGGVIGAAKIASYTKVIFDDGEKRKSKVRDDFSLNALRWGATARIGYENLQIYGTTYFTPMFEKGKGPEFYPYEIGLAFTFN